MHAHQSHYRLQLLLAGLVLLCFGGQSYAGGSSPWQLHLSLHHEKMANALPTALYIDHEKERYYVVDSRAGQLASFDKEGVFLKSFKPSKDPLKTPFDMVRVNSSTLLITEKEGNTLTTIDFAKKKTTRTPLLDQGQALLVDRLEMSDQGLFCLDRRSGRIYKLSPTLAIEQRFELPEGSRGLIDFKIVGEQIWALGQQEREVYQYTANGRLTKRIPLPDQVIFPVSLALDKSRNLYILDRHKAQILVFDRKAHFKYSFLQKGHSLQDLYYPIEIRFDPWGNLCIVDEGNSRVQIFKR